MVQAYILFSLTTGCDELLKLQSHLRIVKSKHPPPPIYVATKHQQAV